MPALDNPRHERFCQLVATPKPNGSIISDIEAYQIAYGSSYDTAHTNAWSLRANTGIMERIKELQAPIEAKRVLTMEKTLEMLHDVALTPAGAVGIDSPLCQGVKYGQEGQITEIKMPSKMEALTLNARIHGWLTDKTETTIRLGIFTAQAPTNEKPAIDV